MNSPPPGRGGFFAWLWRRPRRWFLLGLPAGGLLAFVVGAGIAAASLGGLHYTSTESFCTSCHEMAAPFQEYITRSAWGSVWARESELDRRTRSAVTLAVLTALGKEHEIAMHVRAALRNGLTASEIAEVLLHTAVYAGVPAANRAFAIADEVIREEAAP